MKIPVILLTIITLIGLQATAQNLEYQWVKTVESTENLLITSSDIDADGNIINVGYFRGKAQLDPAGGRILDTTDVMINSHNAFVQKLDSNGVLLWAHAYGADGEERFMDVVVNDQNEIYITGYIKNLDDGNGLTLTTDRPSDNFHDIITLKMSSSGSILWADVMGGSVQDYGRDIALDNDGNIYVFAQYSGTITYKLGDPNGNQFGIQKTSNGRDAVILRYAPNGYLQWVTSMGGTFSEFPRGMDVLDDKIYVQGGYVNSFETFINGTKLTLNTESGQQALFIAQLDTSGTVNWATQLGDGTGQIFESSKLAAHANGVVVTGNAQGQIDYDPGAGFTVLDASTSGTNGYIVNLDTNGDFNWAKLVRERNIHGLAIIDTTIYATVRNKSSIRLYDLGSGDSTGILTFSTHEQINSIIETKTGYIATGDYAFEGDFNPDPNVEEERTNNGTNDGFILKLRAPSASASNRTVTMLPIASYPNPATTYITLDTPNDIETVEVYSVTGQVESVKLSNNTINIRSLPAGVYYIQASAGDDVYTAKFIKQ